jgi:cation transport regulator
MPYKNLDELPDNVKNVLPKHAREIYLAVFNNAEEQYADPEKRQGDDNLEEVSHKVAWAAVKQEYEKDEETGKWKKK